MGRFCMRMMLAVAAVLVAMPAAQAEPLDLPHLTVDLGPGTVEKRTSDRADPIWGPAHTEEWLLTDAGGLSRQVARVVPKKPPSKKRLAHYLQDWQRDHKCVARETSAIPPTMRGAEKLPQVTFEGHCAAPGRFIDRVLLVDGTVYEFAVNGPDALRPEALRSELQALLSSVRFCEPKADSGQGASLNPPSPAPAAPSASPAESKPTCDGFGGRIHGVSSCVRYDRKTKGITRIRDRVMPAKASGEMRCSQELKLPTLRLKLECEEQERLPRPERHGVVAVVIDEDTAHPEAGGRRIVLDEHDGYWNFINVWVAETDQRIDFTIDYGTLD